jgi:hypothetical protein
VLALLLTPGLVSSVIDCTRTWTRDQHPSINIISSYWGLFFSLFCLPFPLNSFFVANCNRKVSILAPGMWYINRAVLQYKGMTVTQPLFLRLFLLLLPLPPICFQLRTLHQTPQRTPCSDIPVTSSPGLPWHTVPFCLFHLVQHS